MSGRSRSPSRDHGAYGRSGSPHRGYRGGHYGGRGYYGPGYGNWGLGTTAGLLLGTTLGAAAYGYPYASPYYVSPYGYPYRTYRYDIYGRPIVYV